MSAVDPARAVALLAREGEARARLREALDAAGARVVLEADPCNLDGDTLTAAGPQAVLVALEPAVEDALEALEPALEAPGLLVIFDEAELASRREGWEAQRWIRHLAAKLNGHSDVLPPGCEQEMSAQLQPGRPITPQQLHAGTSFDSYLDEANAHADGLPRGHLGDAPEPVPGEVAMPDAGAAQQGVPEAGQWVLADDDAAPVPPPALAEQAPAATIDYSTLELVALEEEKPALVGAVLVIAGVGGPDAVRKLIAALPTGFERPLLVQLKLDGGRYDNLVKQLARVSKLPVGLAMPGDAVKVATVYVLPDGVGVAVGAQGLGFVDGGGEPAEALPPVESAVLVLSGADAARVDAVLGLASRGGLVAGQSLEGCYDAAAVKLLAAGGAELGTPAQLAEQLATRWA